MTDKTFTVSHPKALFPITVTGKTLKEALKREGLDPNAWKEVGAAPIEEDKDLGDNQGDAGSQDN